ncbi:hypothetical protein Tco_0715329 [Tanacetum coccineum]
MIYIPMNKQFHAFNTMECRRFVTLQKELSKVINSKISIKVKAKHLLEPAQQQHYVQQFTNQLFETTSSSFSPTTLREPSPQRDPSKGKGVSTEEPKNELVAYMEEGASDPKPLNLKPFITQEGTLSQEDFMVQLKEIKRLADLKAEKEKSEQAIKHMFNQATVKAQTRKCEEHEAKKAKMLEVQQMHL